MSALIKSSILLLPATLVGVYLYLSFGGQDFNAARSHPQQEICQRDGDRLAQIQTKPSLAEAVRFGGELRCLKLWPQLQAVLDSLTQTAGSAGISNPNGAALDASGAPTAPPAALPAPETTSATSDDACKRDEARLAELQAKPSIDKAMRLGSELACSRLRPQLLAVLDGLGRAAEPAEASDSAAPATDLAGRSPPTPGAVSTDGGAEREAANEPAGATNEPPTSSDSAAASVASEDANRRIAALENERDALAAEVGWLARHPDSAPNRTARRRRRNRLLPPHGRILTSLPSRPRCQPECRRGC